MGPEQPGQQTGDIFGGRPPTSHEQLSGQPWDASYHRPEPAPWDTGRAQPAVVRLAAAGEFTGAVLDAGCGTGENALHIASLGLPVLGFDVAETALARARQKASQRGLQARFVAADALRLAALGGPFDTVLDCGLFHSFNADERARYAMSLASVAAPGATLYVLCFSDQGADTGPHPVSQDDLRSAFAVESGWRIDAVVADRVQTTFNDENGAPAWLATMRRI